MAKRKSRAKQNTYQLDVVIPVYGRPNLLKDCLESIEGTKGDINLKLILVDDKGPEADALGKIYHSLNGHSRVVYHQENRGFAKTVNDGIRAGSAPLVLLLNTDVILKPGALQAMMAEFDRPEVGAVGCKLLFPEQSTDPQRPAGHTQHAGLGVDLSGNIIHVNIGWSADHPKVNERREMQAVTGACLMTRRETLNKVLQGYRQGGDPTGGPINEVYGRGTYEDVEYCFAVRALGQKVVYTPEAEAYHHVGSSVDEAGYPVQRNAMIFSARCGQLLIWDEWRYL